MGLRTSFGIGLAPALVVWGLLSAPGQAAEEGPALAAYYLAHAQAVNEACQFLSDQAREELSGYVARAEVAAVEKIGVAGTRDAMARGRAEGRAAGCREDARSSLNETLMAARQAVAQADGGEKPETGVTVAPQTGFASGSAAPEEKALAAPEEEPIATEPAALTSEKRSPLAPKVETKPTQSGARKSAKAATNASATSTAKPRATAKTPPARSPALASYGRMAEQYYYARRCGGMSARQITGFYNQVVATHRSAVANFGVPAVADVMHGAEARANARTCG